jgi:hypothetical protein
MAVGLRRGTVRLAEEHPFDRDAYLTAKEAFVKHILRKAISGQRHRRPLPWFHPSTAFPHLLPSELGPFGRGTRAGRGRP